MGEERARQDAGDIRARKDEPVQGWRDLLRETPGEGFALHQNTSSHRRWGKPMGIAYIALDCSLSMEWDGKLEQAKAGSIGFADDAHKKGYMVGLITFSSSATLVSQPTNDLMAFRRRVNAVGVEGSTRMHEAILLSVEEFDRVPDLTRVLVLVTDGEPDSRARAIRAAQLARSKGVDILAIGTSDADADLLALLVSRADLATIVPPEQLGQGISRSAGMLPPVARQ